MKRKRNRERKVWGIRKENKEDGGGIGTVGIKTTPNIICIPLLPGSSLLFLDQYTVSGKEQMTTMRITNVTTIFAILETQLAAHGFKICLSTTSTMSINSSNRHGSLSKIEQQLPLLLICVWQTRT